MSDTWLRMTAADLGRGIGSLQIDPVALSDAYLSAIGASPLKDRIFARTTEDRARSEAAAAAERARSGNRLSPLDGVPISWKDLFDTRGVATEAGTALLRGRTPDQDAVVLQNATAQGLVCLGKTHMSELAFSGLGYNPITATPPSVNDPNGVAGGSSSGAAASVAFGLSAIAIGSDTGGSVRIPAVWNDLVGLKTTSGRLSLQGVVPLAASFDTVGPLCRSVEDAGLMLAALEGRRPPQIDAASLAGKRLLLLENVALDDMRSQPATGFEAAVTKLAKAGALIEGRKIPILPDAMSLSAILFNVEAYATWRTEIEAAPDKMFAEILGRFRMGKSFSGVDYVRASRELTRLRALWNAAVAGYDAVILPTTPILPPNIERLASDHDYYVGENLLALRNTRIGNLMGLTALTLPTGTPSTGIMLMTPPNTEEMLLSLGAAAEAALV